MPKRATPLTAVKVRTAAPGRYGDGDGLYLLVRPSSRDGGENAAFWVFRYTRAGRMREMGLGRARGKNAVSLAKAREDAAALHRLVRNRVDPLEQRAVEAAAALAAAQAHDARSITFRTVARFCLDAHEAKWSNPKHRQQWSNTLDTYAMPHMGDLPVGDVGTAHVLAALEPIWRTKPETAQRVRGRVEVVLNYAKTREWRAGENPARWRGHLSNLLAPRAKVAPVVHHAALPWPEIAAFMSTLCEQEGVAALALRFAILTAARTGEVIGARWSEFDLSTAVWIVPAERMKGRREHRVPLSDAATTVLQAAMKLRVDESADWVFPGGKAGRPLSNMAMAALLRRMDRGDLTVHGFRSTFRDWAGERTSYPTDVAEAALAHVTGNRTQSAYQRGDLFEKRRHLMRAWAEYCSAPPTSASVTMLPQSFNRTAA
jgi:integrase